MKSYKVMAFAAVSAVAFCAATALAVPAGATLSVNANATVKSSGSTGNTFVVDVNIAGMTANAVGAQATVSYDPALVEFVGLAAGDDLGTIIYQSSDVANSRIIFATGVDPNNPGSGVATGNVAKLTFKAIANACVDTDAVVLGTSNVPTRITDASGNSLAFTSSNAVTLNSLGGFSLSGVPSNADVAADAGTISGALVSLAAPTASDSCGTALTVTATRSDSAALSAYYPLGTTTVHYSATDAAGNTDSSDVTVTVENYQLLDAGISLNGTILGNSTRSIRIKSGARTQVVSVAMTGANGTASDVQVPVAASYSCMSAKDTVHSLTSTGAASVSGVKYAASFALDQGDSNDDDFVDILDFGVYVGKFGAALASGNSNFNADLLVNNADFSFISVNFFHHGASCGSFTGGNGVAAISVKQLRRQGLGYLAASDLNRDGMLDANDVAYYMQHGIQKAERPDAPTVAW